MQPKNFFPATFNGWRVIPRIVLLLYAYMMFESFKWFTGLTDPSANQMAFVSVIWGVAPAIFGFYSNAKPLEN